MHSQSHSFKNSYIDKSAVRILRSKKSEQPMLSRIMDVNSRRSRFQVLFLRNDNSQEVEVHEVGHVDFFTIQQRLENGESVFITSKKSQMISAPKEKRSPSRSMKTKLVRAFSVERA